MDQNANNSLTEDYVKDHYNQGLRALAGEYINRRWFSSVESKFDYMQTKRAILHALGDRRFQNVIELGPGDGVWTRLFAGKMKKLKLFDQSEEMIKRAKAALKEHVHIEYQIGNFATEDVGTSLYDLFISIRCFEYVIDKNAGVKKIADSLQPGGTMIMITKNPHYRSAKRWKPTLLHTEQINKRDMIALLKKHGLIVDAVYPAVYRWKSKFAVARGIFNILQWVTVVTGGRVFIPWITDWSTESYTYVAHKPAQVVELYGLPGSGKTTLATELETESPLIQRYRPTRWGSGLAYFIVTQPGAFCFWIKEFLVASVQLNDWKFFRYRLAILLNTFEAVGTGYRQRTGIVVLEEGLSQRISGVYERKLEAYVFVRLLRSIPKLSVLVLVEGSGDYFKRYEHPDNPRGQRGEVYMQQFIEMLEYNHQQFLRALGDAKIPTVTYTRADSATELAARLQQYS